jgi:hypothetical protein
MRRFGLGLLALALVGSGTAYAMGMGSPVGRDVSQAAGAWQDVCVDCPRWFQNLTDRSVQLDSQGHLHLAYGGDHLYHAWHDGAVWQVETVDLAPDVGAYAALALDSADRLHISYYDAAGGALKYAVSAEPVGVWQVETVDRVGNWYGHGHTALALDSAGRPHVCYYDYEEDILKYTWREAGGWQSPAILFEDGGEHSALALDAAGWPHLVYLASQLGAMRHVWYDGYDWQGEWIEEGVNLLGYPSLALDAAGHPALVYVDGYSDYDLRYAWRDDKGWQVATVDGAGGWYPSLALDVTGAPHISYYVNGELRYAAQAQDGTTWEIQAPTGGSMATVGWGTAVIVNPETGRPHVMYRGRDGHLAHSWHDGAAWRGETVDRSAVAGWDVALALDAANQPHVSYYAGGLAYARLAGTVWQRWTVDRGAYRGGATDLAVDGAGGVHISYQDWERGDLRYARLSGTAWRVETVDAGGMVGEYSSLALDTADRPHISYFDRTHAALKYAWYDGVRWHVERVPSGDERLGGMYTALALDGADQPHISFEANGTLAYAHARRAGTAWQWTVETLDDHGIVGRYSALALDGMDQPHISYYDATNGRLKYAWQEGTAWRVQTVPTVTIGNVGRYTDLALDVTDRPHISFYNVTDGDLVYAFWPAGDADWQVEQVATASSGDVGRYNALALDAAGQPHISYYDASNRDLRYIWLAPSSLSNNSWQVYLPAVMRGQ